MRSSWPHFLLLIAVAYVGYFHRAQMLAVLVIAGTILFVNIWIWLARRFPKTMLFFTYLIFGLWRGRRGRRW